MANIVIPYKPREQFLGYHNHKKRFGISVCHRRAGKTVARINKLLKAALEFNDPLKPMPRFAYIAPYRSQAKDIAWAYLNWYASGLKEIGMRPNLQDLSIYFPHNGATVRLYGAENANSLRGLYFDGIAADEAQDIAGVTLNTVILPCLADRQGWLDVSGTPKGWSNLLGRLVKLAQKEPDDWFLQILKASESKILPDKELALQRKLMTDAQYRQEYECDFDAAITGAVYGEWISDLISKNRITKVSYDSALPVHTAWDLGYGDATAIWFYQVHFGEVRIIDYYSNNNEGIQHYINVLSGKGYKYGKHRVPHDALHGTMAAGGKSIILQASSLGYTLIPIPRDTIANRIEAGRKTLEVCWFDAEKCNDGLDCLKQYQYEYDKDKQMFKDSPLHDWTSHGSDAFGYLAQTWREIKPAGNKEPAQFWEHQQAKDIFFPDRSSNKPRRSRI